MAEDKQTYIYETDEEPIELAYIGLIGHPFKYLSKEEILEMFPPVKRVNVKWPKNTK